MKRKSKVNVWATYRKMNRFGFDATKYIPLALMSRSVLHLFYNVAGTETRTEPGVTLVYQQCSPLSVPRYLTCGCQRREKENSFE